MYNYKEVAKLAAESISEAYSINLFDAYDVICEAIESSIVEEGLFNKLKSQQNKTCTLPKGWSNYDAIRQYLADYKMNNATYDMEDRNKIGMRSWVKIESESKTDPEAAAHGVKVECKALYNINNDLHTGVVIMRHGDDIDEILIPRYGHSDIKIKWNNIVKYIAQKYGAKR